MHMYVVKFNSQVESWVFFNLYVYASAFASQYTGIKAELNLTKAS